MIYLLIPLYVWIAYRAFHLFSNYVKARKFGLPIIILPVSFDDIWWIPLRPLFPWVEKLPFGLGNWYLYTTMGWPTEDGYRTVSRLGETFILCSPAGNVISTSYPKALQKVYGDHKDWIMPVSQSQLFAFFGQNVSSTNGAEWQRHRKITASAFNENTFREVWKETIRRVKDIDIEGEKERTLGRIRTTFDVLALQVVAVVGFGQDNELTVVPPGHQESFIQSLGFILQNITLTLAFSSLKAPDFLLPNILKRLKVSTAEVGLYMKESVLQHLQATKTATTETKHSSLLQAIIKANEAEKRAAQKTQGRPSFLTESEVYGNMFVFNVAGYETTASTMMLGLSFLAANPTAQDWVFEEVNRYCSPDRPISDDYDEIYPKLVRCLSVMYEILRLASPAPLLVRQCIQPTELPVETSAGPTSIKITPGTVVGGNYYGAHLSPRWGADIEAFNPSRFVTVSATGEETLTVPDGPMYGPWLLGTRVCPGKKFSQVEFVALLAHLLKEWRIDVLAKAGEDEHNARERFAKVLDNKYWSVSTYLRNPESAGVKFVKRE